MFDRTGDTFEEGATVANTSEPIANTSTSSEETIELWLSDLIHNIPALRETDNYNKPIDFVIHYLR